MTVSSRLFDKANDYLLGAIDLDELDTWLAEHAPELATLGDNDPMARLSGLIQVTLAEIDDGAAVEHDLRSRVADFLVAYAQMLTIRFSADDSIETVRHFILPWEGQSVQSAAYIAA